MKRIILLFTLALFSFNGFAQVWETQNSGVKNTLRSVCFVDTLNGWVVGDSATILKTTNGGKNWIKQSNPVKFTSLSKVQFVSNAVGFVVGASGLFLSTSDGGINWNASYIMPDSSGFSYGDFCFVNENEGWVPGRKEGKNYGIGLIMHTTDGGKTWLKQLQTFTYVQTDARFFSSVKFQDNKVGWALASDYFDNFSSTFVFKTENSGSTWKAVGEIKAAPATLLSIAGFDTLWVGGGIGKFLISFDGGINWKWNQNEYNFAYAISPVNGSTGWIFYAKPFSKDKKILYTTDAGNTWKEELKLTEEFIHGIENIVDHLWIVGTNGLIMRRSPNITSIDTKESEIPKEFKLYQNYPNPFNSQTTIIYDLIIESDIELKIYNTMGQLIKSFKYSSQPVGSHSVIWSGANNFGDFVSSGVYIYNIIANSKTGKYFFCSSKMIFLK